MPTKRQLAKSEQGLCIEPHCQNIKRKDRYRCHKHDQRRKRAKNPMRAAFRNLKDSASRRGIPFRLTFAQFRKFALETDYINRTGNGKHCYTVDRIKNERGYTSTNIQALTREQNCIKQAKVDKIRMEKGYSWKQ